MPSPDYSHLWVQYSIIYIFSIDATRIDCLARFINDEKDANANATAQLVLHEGKIHLCIFAKRPLRVEEEIRYDYGDVPQNMPWRKVRHYLMGVTVISSTADIGSGAYPISSGLLSVVPSSVNFFSFDLAA